MDPTLGATLRKRLLQRGRALLRGGGRTPLTLVEMSRGDREELTLIHEALDRIERGRYGACDDCRLPIPPDRLERAPWEPRCAACAGEGRAPARAV